MTGTLDTPRTRSQNAIILAMLQAANGELVPMPELAAAAGCYCTATAQRGHSQRQHDRKFTELQ
jgi:hypothetical protein